MGKSYQVSKGIVVSIQKQNKFTTSVNQPWVRRKFFDGVAIIDSRKFLRKKLLEVALVPHAGIKSLTL